MEIFFKMAIVRKLRENNEKKKKVPESFIPSEEYFEAEFCGSDFDNFVYLRVRDPDSVVSLFL